MLLFYVYSLYVYTYIYIYIYIYIIPGRLPDNTNNMYSLNNVYIYIEYNKNGPLKKS